MNKKQVCFVVMGFGKKTDYPTGRVINLDKSYRQIIKPAAEAAGLDCRRADEIIHSGMIDVPMYEQLLMADVVVADVSTSNCNAFYELGVRHALRPYTTITIAEDKMVFPFDVSHIAIHRYQHLGEGIDYEEVERMREELKQAIQVIATKPVDDSPVYTFLKDLKPPLRAVAEAVANSVSGGAVKASETAAPDSKNSGENRTVSALMTEAQGALNRNDFLTAKSLLGLAKTIVPHNPYVTQQLALATYKSEAPSALAALQEAATVLSALQPEVSTDAETLGLWGSIYKRMWKSTADRAHLDTAIFAYEKGFHIKNDHYNGINLAYLYNVRASLSEGQDAVADFVLAERTRRKVITLCEALLNSAPRLPDEEYWIRATMAQAWLGLGDEQKSQEYLAQASALEPRPVLWKQNTTREQLQDLEKLLAGFRQTKSMSA